jgi:hypothetical protein
LSQAQLIHTFDRRNSSDSCCISAVSLWKKDNQPANRPTCDFQLSRVFEWGRHEVNLGQFLRWKELPVWFGTLSQKTSVSTLFQRWSEHPENSADAFRPFYHQKILSFDIVMTPFLPWWSGSSKFKQGSFCHWFDLCMLLVMYQGDQRRGNTNEVSSMLSRRVSYCLNSTVKKHNLSLLQYAAAEIMFASVQVEGSQILVVIDSAVTRSKRWTSQAPHFSRWFEEGITYRSSLPYDQSYEISI